MTVKAATCFCPELLAKDRCHADLNRPERMNALSRHRSWRGRSTSGPRLAGDPALQVIMLTVAGPRLLRRRQRQESGRKWRESERGRLWWKFARLTAGGNEIRNIDPRAGADPSSHGVQPGLQIRCSEKRLRRKRDQRFESPLLQRIVSSEHSPRPIALSRGGFLRVARGSPAPTPSPRSIFRRPDTGISYRGCPQQCTCGTGQVLGPVISHASRCG
jgi:hypothetical protein